MTASTPAKMPSDGNWGPLQRGVNPAGNPKVTKITLQKDGA